MLITKDAQATFFSGQKFSNLKGKRDGAAGGVVMSSGFLQGVAFFALAVVVVIAAFGGFGSL